MLYSVKKKGFFPYDYCDSFEKFNEDLPNKDKLYSSLTNFEISDEHYEQQVVIIENYLEWKTVKLSWVPLKKRCFKISWFVSNF